MNGVGLEFNHLFGFGVLDAGAMVALAKDWVTVPPRYHCQGGIYQMPKYVLFIHQTEQEVDYLDGLIEIGFDYYLPRT